MIKVDGKNGEIELKGQRNQVKADFIVMCQQLVQLEIFEIDEMIATIKMFIDKDIKNAIKKVDESNKDKIKEMLKKIFEE